jgi:phosphoserine aminotransferase
MLPNSVTSLPLNFSAGPTLLPKAVTEQAAKAMINYNNTGMSILELSHREYQF